MTEAAPPTKPGAWTVRHTKRTLRALPYSVGGLGVLYGVLLAVTPSLQPPDPLWARRDAVGRLVVASEPSYMASLNDFAAVSLTLYPSAPRPRLVAKWTRGRTGFEQFAGLLRSWSSHNEWTYVSTGRTEDGWWEFERE